MKYRIERTTQFKRDFKLAEKQGMDMTKLADVVRILSDGEMLPREYLDHELQGKYKGYRECHIEPDWLLLYKITESVRVIACENRFTQQAIQEIGFLSFIK